MNDGTGIATNRRGKRSRRRRINGSSAGALMKEMLLSLLLVVAIPAAAAGSGSFALIGDTPYSDFERRELPRMIAAIGNEHVDFMLHIGDIKHSRDACSDALFEDRHRLFAASPVPFVLVPGDNEWADCDRVIAGHFDPQERLGRLREIFFRDAVSLGERRMALERQAGEFREHQRWQLGSVLFLSLNVPGSNNNWNAAGEPGAEAGARMPHVLAWLREGFVLAARKRLRGIVVAIHADPGFGHFGVGFGHSAYRELIEALRRETLAFSGQVLLVHGDTHWQRIDHPLRHPETGRPLANFTRVETFGYPYFGWIKVTIDPGLPALFRFEVHDWQAPLPSQIR